MGLKSFLKICRSFIPDHGHLLKLGYKAKIYNGDFILFKDHGHFSLGVHQGVEPYNSRFGHLIDFEIEHACIIVEIKERYKLRPHSIDKGLELFDYAYDRGTFLFCMDRKMEIDDPRIPAKVEQLKKKLLEGAAAS